MKIDPRNLLHTVLDLTEKVYQGTAVTLAGVGAAHLVWSAFRRKADAMSSAEIRDLISTYGPKLIEWVKDATKACKNCGGYGYGYMLKNEVWDTVNGSPHGLLCLACVEKRLGRPLEVGDFMEEASINEPIFHILRAGHPPPEHEVLDAEVVTT